MRARRDTGSDQPREKEEEERMRERETGKEINPFMTTFVKHHW